VEHGGSLAVAARTLGVSYRYLWGLFRRWETHTRLPLLQMQQGRGALLTDAARALLVLDERIRSALAPHLAQARAELERGLAELARRPGARAMRVVASHDLAIARLPSASRTAGPALDLSFRGSLEALSALAAGECDVAGFHAPDAIDWKARTSPYAKALARGDYLVARFCIRELGLIVATGNPAGIRSVRDLVRPRVRLVNRQRGSGSRITLDHLLAVAGIAPRRVHGYGNEEFTHLAVAATVASGHADAGVGIRAAAAEYGLDFVALARDEYFFAARDSADGHAALAALVARVRSADFRRRVRGLPGYDFTVAGEPAGRISRAGLSRRSAAAPGRGHGRAAPGSSQG
jgi:molybdate transport repressor ModE-like protein